MPACRFSSTRPSRFATIAVFAASVVVATLAGCNSAPTVTDLTNPYRATVVQGNFVSREQVAAIRPGMTRQQVRDVLGTSLLTSVFHENRWDYVFTMRIGNQPMKEYRLTTYFLGDKLERVEGDQMPAEAEFIAQIDTGKKPDKVPVLQATEAQLNKTAPSSNPAADAAATAATAPDDGPPRTNYPPLESPAR